MKTAPLILMGTLALASAQARTIVLTDRDVTLMGSLNSRAPTVGWASYDQGNGSFVSSLINFPHIQGFVIRFPIEPIPRDHRIVNAELLMPLHSATAGMRVFVWRLLVDWGVGVSHQYRRTVPQRVEWSVPGALGKGVDRAVEPTNVVTQPRTQYHLTFAVNVTKDIELWHSGAAPNNGWLLTGDDSGLAINFKSPFSGDGVGAWQLRITHEPK